MMQFLVALVLGGLGMVVASRLVSGFEIKGGFGSAMVVALVYGLLKAALQKPLAMLTLPLVLLTVGLFLFVINAFLLWVTDKLLNRLEIKSTSSLLGGTLVLTIFDWACRALVHYKVF
jgi:putative membrane protein